MHSVGSWRASSGGGGTRCRRPGWLPPLCCTPRSAISVVPLQQQNLLVSPKPSDRGEQAFGAGRAGPPWRDSERSAWTAGRYSVRWGRWAKRTRRLRRSRSATLCTRRSRRHPIIPSCFKARWWHTPRRAGLAWACAAAAAAHPPPAHVSGASLRWQRTCKPSALPSCHAGARKHVWQAGRVWDLWGERRGAAAAADVVPAAGAPAAGQTPTTAAPCPPPRLHHQVPINSEFEIQVTDSVRQGEGVAVSRVPGARRGPRGRRAAPSRGSCWRAHPVPSAAVLFCSPCPSPRHRPTCRTR